MLSLVVSNFAQVREKDEAIEVVYRQTQVRAVVEHLGKHLGKSVVFDINVANSPIDFTATLPRSQVFEKLLQDNHLFSVEVGGVTIVARDSADMRGNYSAARVAACAVKGPESARTNVVFRGMGVEGMIKILAESLGRTAELELVRGTMLRQWDFEMRDVTRAEALQIICLIGHMSLTDDGKRLEFSPAKVNK